MKLEIKRHEPEARPPVKEVRISLDEKEAKELLAVLKAARKQHKWLFVSDTSQPRPMQKLGLELESELL